MYKLINLEYNQYCFCRKYYIKSDMIMIKFCIKLKLRKYLKKT